MIFEQNLEKWFLLVLNMSLTSSVVILAVLCARLFLKKAPKIFSYALWAAVLFRLLIPVSFSLPLSLLGALQNKPAQAGRMEYIAEDIGYRERPEIAMPVPGLSGAVNGRLPQGAPAASVNPLQIYINIGACLWLSGVLSLWLYSALSLWRLRGRLKGAVLERENVYRIAEQAAPFVCGLFSPRIYLPERLGEEERRYILLHEQIHIRRGDPWFRLLAWFALCLHWFNPLVWLAFSFSGRDMEMSCDEAVILRLGGAVKREYSASLLNQAAGSRIVKGLPLAFGESDVKSRIKNVLRFRKPAAIFTGAAAVCCVLLALFFLANPAEKKAETDGGDAAAAGKQGQAAAPVEAEAVTQKEAQGKKAAPAEAEGFAQADAAQEKASAQAEESARETAKTPEYANVATEDTGSEWLELLPERLRNGELLDGLYVVNVRSVSSSARGFDRYVTWEEETDLPLFPFAEDCQFRVNRAWDKVAYSPVSFDEFVDLITELTKVINPTVYCEVVDNQIVRADLESADDFHGISYKRPVKDAWGEDIAGILGMTKEEALAKYYALGGTETADIADSPGEEKIEVYTGDIGDGKSGVVLFKDAAGRILGTESAHASRAGWNNIYIGEAEGVGFILTVHIEDRDDYGDYGYQVFRFGEDGAVLQIAGSGFSFGKNYQYDDEMFHRWADDLSYYLEKSLLILSSQEGEIRTERVSEAEKYNYETLRRK